MPRTRAYRHAAGGRPRRSIAHAEPWLRSWPFAPGKGGEAVDVRRLGCLGAWLAQQHGHALHVLVAGHDPGLAIGGYLGTGLRHQHVELPLERPILLRTHDPCSPVRASPDNSAISRSMEPTHGPAAL